MEITAAMVKELRERTGAGVLECRNALAEAHGDFDKATDLLRERGLAKAARKMDRETNQGLIEAYVHAGGRVGALVELNCETDFVARTPDFKELAHDLVLQVVAANPRYLDASDVPAEVLENEKVEIRRGLQTAPLEGKPAHIVDKIVANKLESFLDEVCLLRQPFIKDGSSSVRELITAKIAQIGENIVVRRFVRFELGDSR
jgi:elongation factor Ts